MPRCPPSQDLSLQPFLICKSDQYSLLQVGRYVLYSFSDDRDGQKKRSYLMKNGELTRQMNMIHVLSRQSIPDALHDLDSLKLQRARVWLARPIARAPPGLPIVCPSSLRPPHNPPPGVRLCTHCAFLWESLDRQWSWQTLSGCPTLRSRGLTTQHQHGNPRGAV